MKKPLPYLSEEALEQLRACGPREGKELVRFWLEVGFLEGYRLEDYYSAELIAEVKQEMAVKTWIEMTENWAHGSGGVAYYHVEYDDEDPLEEQIEEFVSERSEKYYWSDKYRGVSWQKVDRPPKAWLEEKLRELELRIKYAVKDSELIRDELKHIAEQGE